MINLNSSAMQKIVQKKFGLEKYINIKKIYTISDNAFRVVPNSRQKPGNRLFYVIINVSSYLL